MFFFEIINQNVLRYFCNMKHSENNWLVYYPLMLSFIITQFLFFIDEGYCDFRWMKSGGNWLVFVIYLIIIFLSLAAFNLLLMKLKVLSKKSMLK